MTKPPTITLEDVVKACDQIRSLEQRPTVDRVYALLKKGSRTTVNRLLREHLRQYESESTIPKVDCPPAALLKFREAIALSNKDRDESIQLLQKDITSKDEHIQEILKESEELETNHNVLKTQHDALVAKHKECEVTIKGLNGEAIALKTEIKSLQDFKEKFISQKSRNDAIAEQIGDYKTRIKELEVENRSLLERAIKAEK
ncbi:MAG: DNA-binding protein [Candidatus Brocadiales bacterium]|nr:DNA-binding protein [Candidatus Brocadiales bacterium]